MPLPLIVRAGALALACASTVSAIYTLAPEDDYSGESFMSGFYFNTTNDPNGGFVDYLGPGDPLFDSLAYYDTTTGTTIFGVDHWNTYSTVQTGTNRGRPSILAQTIKTYQYGLFVVDLAHMPAGSCGTWPAFWTSSLDHWPEQGEIDIIENINSASFSDETLHTGPVFPGDVCEVVGNVNTNPGQQTGTQTTYNCMWNATTSDYGTGTQYSGQGCSANNNDAYNFGTGFNAVGGGVYVMEWTDELIQIWSFGSGPGSTPPPEDLTAGNPDPLGWGNPIFTTWGGNCDIARHFIDHTVIFDTTFCGSWAGQQGIWETTSCYDPVTAPTCTDYVAANPSTFSETYWSINSLKIYQFSDAVVSSSTTSSSTTSTSSTSSTAATITSFAATTTTPSTPSSTAVPSPDPTVGAYEEIGCYTEATASRALTLASKINYSTMTWQICADFCQAYGALYFGVEYGGECYCGNELEAGSVITTFDQCSQPCDGDATETCGGSDRLNLFRLISGSSSSSSVASSTSSTTSTTSSSSSSSVASSTSSTTSTTSSSSSSSVVSSTSSTSSTTSTIFSNSLVAPPTSSSSSSADPTSSSSSSSLPSSSTISSSFSSSLSYPTTSSSLGYDYPTSTSSPISSSSTSSTATSSSTADPTSSSSSSSSSSPSYPTTSSSIGYDYPTSSISSSSTIYSYTNYSSPTSTSSLISSYPTTSSSIGYDYPTSSISSSSTIYLYTNYSTPTSTSSVSLSYTTSTVSTTTVYTITSCAPTVTNCPAKIGQVTTDTIILYTTVCPVTATEASSPNPTYPSGPEETTLTISTTIVYTITSCAPTVTNCPAKIGSVTTETIELYTTVCPISEAISLGLIPTPTPTPAGTYIAAGVTGPSASTSTTVISTTVVKISTITVKPLSYNPTISYTAIANGTIAASTGIVAGTSASTGASSSPSPIYKAGAPRGMQTGSGLAIVVAAVAAIFL